MTRWPLTPDESPGFLLWHATLRWQRAIAAALGPLGLTHVQFVLLAGAWWLGAHGGPPSQRELADQSGTDPMMTSQVVRILERRELLTRSADPRDSRVRRLAVTPEGARLAQRAIDIVEAGDARFFAPVADQPALLAILQALGGRAPR
jgi:DNA-binding MarR family transcriptional regulator